jgi:hypothetical protein
VTCDKQTLILAGESIPRRDAVEPRLTIVATRADDMMLLARRDTGPRSDSGQSPTSGESPALMLPVPAKGQYPARFRFASSARGAAFNALNEYARTQDISGGIQRAAIIDTYA